MNTTQTPRQLPLGIADFERMRRQGYYYVDKTMYIPKLEFASSYLFFVRPRRFGKSLLLSMLRAYYDINMADRFQEYFGDLWIGRHPTPLRNSSSGNVARNSGSIHTACGIQNEPTEFFSVPIFSAVLPPMEASTIDSSVVGTFT